MNYKELTLLEGYCGIAKNGSYISLVNGRYIYWDYRRGDHIGDGYNPSVDRRENATEIFLEVPPYGANTIPLSPECDTHPALAQIYADYDKNFPSC